MIKSKSLRAVLYAIAGVLVGTALLQSNEQPAPHWLYLTAAVVLSPIAYTKGHEWRNRHEGWIQKND